MSAGILAVALAGLKYSGARRRHKANNLVLLLRCLVSSRFLFNIDKAENIITLLRMQGLMRVSDLLCPVLGPTEASADDMREGVLPLVFLAQVWCHLALTNMHIMLLWCGMQIV